MDNIENGQTLNDMLINSTKIIYERKKEVEEVDVPENVLDTWQKMLNIIADIFNIPSALIMKVKPPHIEVLLASETENNPYHVEEKEHLAGLYCNTVMVKGEKLLVPNARKTEAWKNNPDIKLGMVSYLGYPLKLPNGEMFGTICVLDDKTNYYSKEFEEILANFKTVVEDYIKLVYKEEQLAIEVEKRRELQRIIEEQRDFQILLNTMLKHDMKNKISVLNGLIQMVEIEKKDENIHERMVSTIENVFNLLEQAWSLHDLAMDYGEEYWLTAEKIREIIKPYGVEAEIRGDFPIRMTKAITIILANLIDNAVEHGKTDKITIESELKKEEVVLTFIDYGKGIPPIVRTKIFDKGYVYGDTGKTGLGLYIVKTIVNQIGGEIELLNNEPKGTKVVLRLPK